MSPVGGRSGWRNVAAAARLRVGRWHVDPAARMVEHQGQCTRLTPRAMQVLLVLAEAAGRVVSRSELMDAVWTDVHVGDESLTQAVAELRRAFGDRRGAARVIETVQKGGYRLLPPVVSDAATDGASTADDLPAGIVEATPLEAHLAIMEARRLARTEGFPEGPKIAELIKAAVAIAPGDGAVQAHFAEVSGLAALHRGKDMAPALAAAERAVQLRPDLAIAHRALGYVAAGLGLSERCQHAFARALSIDPGDAGTHHVASRAFFGLGHYGKALILAERAAGLRPDDFRPALLASRAALAMGDRQRAAELAGLCLARLDTRLAQAPHELRQRSARATTLSILGRSDEALAAMPGADATGRYYYDVTTLAEVGELERAVDALEALLDSGWRYARWLKVEPTHRRLCAESRYRRLVERLEAA